MLITKVFTIVQYIKILLIFQIFCYFLILTYLFINTNMFQQYIKKTKHLKINTVQPYCYKVKKNEKFIRKKNKQVLIFAQFF